MMKELVSNNQTNSKALKRVSNLIMHDLKFSSDSSCSGHKHVVPLNFKCWRKHQHHYWIRI